MFRIYTLLTACWIKIDYLNYTTGSEVNIAPFDAIEIIIIMFLKILWKMEHVLFWSKCSIFHNIFKSIQNLT